MNLSNDEYKYLLERMGTNIYMRHMVNVTYIFCGGCQENYHYLYILRFYLIITYF